MAEHLYEVAVTKTTAGAAAGPIATIVPATPGAGIRLPIWVINNGGGVEEIALGIPAAAGTGAVTGKTVQPLNTADPAGHTQLATSFATTQPTAPANPFRQEMMQAVAGYKVPWIWGMAAFIPVVGATVSQIVIWQLTAVNNAYDIYIQTAE
jgi:hypothetical protein